MTAKQRAENLAARLDLHNGDIPRGYAVQIEEAARREIEQAVAEERASGEADVKAARAESFHMGRMEERARCERHLESELDIWGDITKDPGARVALNVVLEKVKRGV